MNPSDVDLLPLRLVAQRLGDLREDVVFVGGAIRPLLLTDPAAPPTRHTDDVDLIVPLAARVHYGALRDKLLARGFREDTRPEAPLCRWVVDGVTVDVMPTDASVFGFTNPWYEHAIKTAMRVALGPELSIRIVSAPCFVATKLAAFASRGAGDWAHHDVEDLVAVVDGRAELVGEVERDELELRSYVGAELTSMFARGFEEAVRWHLPSDSASDLRLPEITTRLRRLARRPRILAFGESVKSTTRGGPGSTGGAVDGPWEYVIHGVEKVYRTQDRRAKGVFAIVSATLTSWSPTAGGMDGRDLLLEESNGVQHPPLYDATIAECGRRGVTGPQGVIWPRQPFETVLVYDVPRDASGLRLLLPFESVARVELPISPLKFVLRDARARDPRRPRGRRGFG
jgi:hypothetical protein